MVVRHRRIPGRRAFPVSSTAGRQHLRSAAHHDLTIPRSRLARCGSRSFATSGRSLWNSLPLTRPICDSTPTFDGFCSRLKTELYKRGRSFIHSFIHSSIHSLLWCFSNGSSCACNCYLIAVVTADGGPVCRSSWHVSVLCAAVQEAAARRHRHRDG